MKILELFSGTESFSKIARSLGHQTFTIDNDSQFNSDLCKDIMDVTIKDINFHPDIIWASPPCTSFSVASIGKNWNIDKTPKSEGAFQSIKIMEKTLELIKELNPQFFILENPRAMLRTLPFMQGIPRVTITYCQYGESRMKPTDLWTNLKWEGKQCKNGMTCHDAAPRGSRTGTQGIKNAKERSIVPENLCLELIKECEIQDKMGKVS